ncbi:hypothetical protein [Bacillus infantis]|uniref:hypothetical protein n=1 Tax=Bacillus infantis TaxID=324767 RepID=UPI00209D8975|nr:hypothetical protein [Bacillus infantis]MCP1159468.1 hypothetical protein [Bacillus infantis]
MTNSPLPPRKKAKGFWNDSDGLSITDTLSVGFSILFAIVSIMMFIKLWKEDLTMQSIDFFQVFSYPMLIILSGYFGNKIVENLGAKRNFKKKEITSVSSPPPTEYNYQPDEITYPEEVTYEEEINK